ncbi:MAG: outer membrane protein transport protein [Flavobacteriaceae bacterium]|nr:outer membrane protein transport protein [Flavobacteriaceae bacterium]
MIKKLCLVFIAFLALNVHSQEGTTSPYSFYGIGSLKFKGTAENRSMGGLSIYTDSIHLNLRNPASYAGNHINSLKGEGRIIKFTVGGSHSLVDLKSSSSSANTNTTTFDYLAMSVPMGKFGMAFGLLPITSVGYKLEFTNNEDVLTNRYRGEGGVNVAFLGLGYQITKNLSIGIAANYNFGNIKNSAIKFVYDDEGNPLQYQSRESNRSDLSGINFNVGISYRPMITDKLQLASAFTFSPKADLTSNNERIFASIVINDITGQEFPVNEIEADLESAGLKQTDLTLPAKTSFGLGIGKPNKWFIGAEYTFLKTSQFSNRVFNIDNTTFVDASTISFGGFYIPQYNSFNKYFKRVVYRAGIRFENTGLEIKNETINEFGISFGVGLPVGGFFSNANLGFEIGKKGTTNQNLVQENFINFQISLSLNDLWFVKRKYN